MAVNTGTRPGTKPTQNIPGSDYVRNDNPEWQKIRGNDREVQRYDAALNNAVTNLEKALIAANIAKILLHGGHVDKGKMAQAGMKKDMTPSQALHHIQQLLPQELGKSALG